MSYSKTLTSYSLEVIHDMILSIIYIIFLLYLESWFHEGGHYLAASQMGLTNITLEYTNYGFPNAIHINMDELNTLSCSGVRYILVVFSGLVAGIIPLIYAYKHTSGYYKVWTVVIFGFYVYYGLSSSDVSQILTVLGVV